MWLSNKRPRRLNYSVNKKWPKAWNKVEKAISCYKKLQQRISIEWQTKWIENAVSVVKVKLNKYWINPNKI